MATQRNEITIYNATTEDFSTIMHILNAAFDNEPFFHWLNPDPEKRAKQKDGFLQLHAQHALAQGAAQIAAIPELGPVAVHITFPGNTLDSEGFKDIEGMTDEYIERFNLAGERLGEYYPPVARFEHLALMSVLPQAHSYGIGSTLLAHRLAELDKQGVPSYLEAVNRRVAGGICARYGFQPIGDPINLDNETMLFPMWRPVPSLRPLPQLKSGNEEDVSVGNIIQFGGYSWRVLEIQDTQVLLLSEKVLEHHMFHNDFEDVTWANCTLRKYLNGDFYHAFDKASQSKIIETRVSNYYNPWFRTPAGNDTSDRIFVLSIDEVVDYFGDSKQLRNKNPNSMYYVNDHFNGVRKAIDVHDKPTW